MTKHYSFDYVLHIRDAINFIDEYIFGMSLEEFLNDHKTQDATIRQIEIIGEAASKIDTQFRQDNQEINWQKASDMRNRLIHGYEDINLEIVWRTATEDLPDLKKKIKNILGNN